VSWCECEGLPFGWPGVCCMSSFPSLLLNIMMRSSPIFFEKTNLFYKSRTVSYSCSYLLWGNRSTIARPIPQYGLRKKDKSFDSLHCEI
jgi:hypothetical protein